MKRISAVVLCIVLLSSCSDSFKKFKDGTEYKVISDNKGKKIEIGNVLEIQVIKKYQDSVLYDSRDVIPQFAEYQPSQMQPVFIEMFKDARVGDSMVMRIMTDSLYKTRPMPPFEKKGGYEVTTFKIINAFKTKEEADQEYKKLVPMAKLNSSRKMNEQIKKELETNKAQMQADDKILGDYISAHNLSAVKAPWGTYVVITNPGTGVKLSDTSIVKVNYTGKTLDGRVFDSNTDSAFGHKQTLPVDMGQVGTVIYGWTDGLKMMSKGSKGMFLIPSTLGYGKNGSGDKIKPNENLIFDVEVVDVMTNQEFMEEQQRLLKEEQKQAELKQAEQSKKFMEKLKKDSAKNKKK